MKKKFYAALCVALFIAAAVLLLCLALPPAEQQKTDERLVITSFHPIYLFAQNLLQDTEGIRLECLSSPSTGCLHDYQLLTGDMERLSRADAFIICGGGMEGFLERAVTQFPAIRLIDSSTGIALLQESEEGDEEDEVNAHFWLDPSRAVIMVKNIADGLCACFPDQREQILKNRDSYTERLTQLDKEIEEGLSRLRSRNIVTFHEAFPYFAERYDLNIVAVMTLQPDEPLSMGAMTALTDLIRQNGTPPLFTEPLYSSAAAEVISRETGSGIYVLDPVVSGDTAPEAYEEAMRSNMRTLQTALGLEE